MICVLSVSGWEEYVPIYFEADSKEEFDSVVAEAIKIVIPGLSSKNENYIGGHDVMDKILPIISEKFKQIKVEHEVDLRGSCYYMEKLEDKPKIIDDVTWDTIIKYNEKLNEEMYKDIKERMEKEGEMK